MSLQTTKGFNYPQYTDTPDVPRDIYNLATEIDSYLTTNRGPQGLQGVQGVQGVQGTQGLQGIQGYGYQQLQGIQGIQGLQGQQGIQGVQGLQGTQGTQGIQSLQGLQGIQGLIGPAGPNIALAGVEAATTGPLSNSPTYSDGITMGSDGGYGFNATLTATSYGALIVDGYEAPFSDVGDRILVKDQVDPKQNGIYALTQGDSTHYWILTRTTDFDNYGSGSEVQIGVFTTVYEGDTNNVSTWMMNSTGTGSGEIIKIGSDDIVWTRINGAAIQGTQGTLGHQGIQGLQGTQGIQGIQGLQGGGYNQAQGLQGIQGLQGTQSIQGLQGAQGTQGLQGFGYSQLQGIQGSQGIQGIQGIQGSQGIQGIQGLQGLQGFGYSQLQGLTGNTGAQGIQGLQGNQGVQGTTPSVFNGALVTSLIENINVSNNASGNSGVNLYTNSGSVLYYTSAATSNFSLNIAASNSIQLNSLLSNNQSITVVFLNTTDSNGYYLTSLTIDGSSVTPIWLGGSAPSSGIASGIDAYSFTIIKTASATYTVLATQTGF